jgi:hypothetical protein
MLPVQRSTPAEGSVGGGGGRGFDERIEHQAATIDVLKAMSASPCDAQPVFDPIVRPTRELCNGKGAGLLEFDGKLVHSRAWYGQDPAAIRAVAFSDAALTCVHCLQRHR